MKARNALKTLSVFLPILLSSCGGDSGDDFTFGFVKDVRVDPESIAVGANATVIVDFDPNTLSKIDSEGDESESVQDTEVAVLLPPGLDFVNGSSEFDGSILDGFDSRPPNEVEICSDGSRALRYSFKTGELSTLGNNRIRLQGKAFEPRGTVVISAGTDSAITSPCEIVGQDSDQLVILP
jgi:hypothetical protein